MPSREPELYKDKIEVSLDGRQIFYLFFGGAVIVGLVFVLGVVVGRRVEARGHLDRAQTQTASDPLAALDRLERSDKLSFHGALTGSEAPTDVERAIGELDKRRVKPDRPDARAEPVTRPDADKPRPDKHDGDKHDGDKHDGDKHDGDKHDGDKHDSDKKSKKHDDGTASEVRSEPKQERSDARRPDAKGDKPVTHPDAKGDKPVTHSDARADDAKPADGKPRFTLQLSSFQDRAEAEAFLTATKSAGYQPYLTEAEVSGKGTFYRVRLGSYRSLEAANDAKADYEKAAKKSAQVMRL
jgi:cell division septation protein DedD